MNCDLLFGKTYFFQDEQTGHYLDVGPTSIKSVFLRSVLDRKNKWDYDAITNPWSHLSIANWFTSCQMGFLTLLRSVEFVWFMKRFIRGEDINIKYLNIFLLKRIELLRKFTWIIWTVVFRVIPEGVLVSFAFVDTGDCCCWCPGEFRGSVGTLFPPVLCIILLPLCDLVKGGGITADVPGLKCLPFGAELDLGRSRSWI